jgi:hypothetical protein
MAYLNMSCILQRSKVENAPYNNKYPVIIATENFFHCQSTLKHGLGSEKSPRISDKNVTESIRGAGGRTKEDLLGGSGEE